MKGISALATTLALASSVVASPAKLKRSVTPITVKGNAFWQGDQRFYIRGVDYQPGGSSDPIDPIANAETCKRDIPYFQKLGLNTIRVYTVDNSANHDECMNALADAGIYLALDVNSGLYSINRADPAPSYNNVYLQYIFATIDAFAGYDNTLLYFSGNEVINTATNTNAAPYVKAVTRDMKQYIGERGYRQVPVGYSAADVSQNRYQMASYMNCGPTDARSDFFSFNDYSWCDPSSFQTSGWAAEVQLYQNYSIPLFLSEYGCNTNVRKFQEVHTLYSSKMSSVYSGGLVYEYSEEVDNPNYGLVQIESNTAVKELADFHFLQRELANVNTPSGDGGYHDNLPPLQCPEKGPYWDVSGDSLPAMPAGAVKYLKDGAGPGPGLNGPGSQDAGTPSSGNAAAGSGDVTHVYGDGSTTSTSSSNAAASSHMPDVPAGSLFSILAVVVSCLLGGGMLL